MTRTVVRTKTVSFRLLDGRPETEAHARRFYFDDFRDWKADGGCVADVVMTAQAARAAIQAGQYVVTRRRGYWHARLETDVP